MENKFKDEIIVDLDNVFVVPIVVGQVHKDGDQKSKDVIEYNIAIMSPNKPRKAYYVCKETITTNVVDIKDYSDEDYDEVMWYLRTKIDDHNVESLIDFVSQDWFDYNFAEKCSIVEKLIGNQHRMSIKQLKNFEKLFNDRNFKTKEEIEYERREKQKQEDDKILDEMFK